MLRDFDPSLPPLSVTDRISKPKGEKNFINYISIIYK